MKMDFSLGTEKYEAEITSAEAVEGDYGLQVVIKYQTNKNFEKTGYYGVKYVKEGVINPRCKFGVLLKKLKAIGCEVNSTEKLIGLKFEVEDQDWVFGKNKETGEDIVARNTPTPIKMLSEITIKKEETSTKAEQKTESKENVTAIIEIAKKLLNGSDKAKITDLIDEVVKIGKTEEEANKLIDSLLRGGEFYQPTLDTFAIVLVA
jgi:hypothetical protein